MVGDRYGNRLEVWRRWFDRYGATLLWDDRACRYVESEFVKPGSSTPPSDTEGGRTPKMLSALSDKDLESHRAGNESNPAQEDLRHPSHRSTFRPFTIMKFHTPTAPQIIASCGGPDRSRCPPVRRQGQGAFGRGSGLRHNPSVSTSSEFPSFGLLRSLEREGNRRRERATPSTARRAPGHTAR